MRIFICASKHFYHKIPRVKEELEKQGHQITFPNSFEDPMREEKIKKQGEKEHREFKQEMYKEQEKKVKENDALLILNYKKGEQENYIGGSVLLEMYEAWKVGKKIFLMNPVPTNMLKDEIDGLNPIILNGNLSKIIQ